MKNVQFMVWAVIVGSGPTWGQELPQIEAIQKAVRQGAAEPALDLLLPLAQAEWERKEVWKTAVRVLGLAHQLGQPQIAERFATTLLAQAGNNFGRKQSVLQVLVRSGFAERALKEYEALIQQDRLNPWPRVGASESLLSLGRHEEALANAEVSLNVKKNFAPGHVMRAKSLLAQGKIDPAEQEAREAVRLEAGNAEALGVLAQALLRRGEMEDAAWFVEQGQQQDPEEVEVLFAAALAQEMEGEAKEAQQTWDRYLEADPASIRAELIRAGLLVVRTEKIVETGWLAFPTFSPDGKWLAYVRCLGEKFNASDGGPVVLQPLDPPGEPQVLTDEDTVAKHLSWSPDGRYLACELLIPAQPQTPGKSWQARYVRLLDVQTRQQHDPAPDLATSLFPHWSVDGRKLLVYGSKQSLQWDNFLVIDLESGEMTPVPGFAQDRPVNWSPDWSPDGTKMVGSQYAFSREGEVIRLFSCDGSTPPLALSERRVFQYFPTFTPDGDKVVFWSKKRGAATADLWWSYADGHRKELPLLMADTFQIGLGWNPNGRQFAYSMSGDGIWMATLAGKQRFASVALTANLEGGAAFGTQSQVEITAHVRSLTAQPDQAELSLRVLDSAGNVLADQNQPLTLPPRQTQSVPLEVVPGKRGDLRAVATLKTDYGDVTQSLPFTVRESRQERLPIALLPWALISATPQEDGWLAWALREGLEWRLRGLWQLDVLEGERVRRRLGLPVRSADHIVFYNGVMEGMTPPPARPPMFGEGGVPPFDRMDEATRTKIAQTFLHSRWVLVGQAQTAEGGSWRAEIRILDVQGQKFDEGKSVTIEGKAAELLSGQGQMAMSVAKALGLELEEGQEKMLSTPPTPSLEAYVAYARGCFLLERGSLSEAEAALSQAVALEAGFGRGHWALGQLYSLKGGGDEAAAELQIAAALAPDDEQVQMALLQGNVFWRLPDRMAQIRKVLALNPHNSSAHFLLAQQYQRSGQGQGMIAELEKARQDPYFAEEQETAIEQSLARAYAQNPDLDPRLQGKVEEDFEERKVPEVLGKLSQLSGVNLTAAGPEWAERTITVKAKGRTVGAVMRLLAEQLKAQWTRTGQGFFLMAKGEER